MDALCCYCKHPAGSWNLTSIDVSNDDDNLHMSDLLSVCAASEGMLKWLKAPALPRPFVLDLLDFVLGNSAAVFRYSLPLTLPLHWQFIAVVIHLQQLGFVGGSYRELFQRKSRIVASQCTSHCHTGL